MDIEDHPGLQYAIRETVDLKRAHPYRWIANAYANAESHLRGMDKIGLGDGCQRSVVDISHARSWLALLKPRLQRLQRNAIERSRPRARIAGRHREHRNAVIAPRYSGKLHMDEFVEADDLGHSSRMTTGRSRPTAAFGRNGGVVTSRLPHGAFHGTAE